MVMSLDGSTVVEGNSRALSGDADRSILVGLRSLADVIVVGSSTVRIDDYGPPSRKDLRVGVVSRTGNVDLSTPLFTSGAGFLIIPEDAPVPANPSITCIRAGRGSVDFAAAMCQLDGNFIQLEGGPGLNASMAQADLIDEINLTISAQTFTRAGKYPDRRTLHQERLGHFEIGLDLKTLTCVNQNKQIARRVSQFRTKNEINFGSR